MKPTSVEDKLEDTQHGSVVITVGGGFLPCEKLCAHHNYHVILLKITAYDRKSSKGLSLLF